MNEYSLKAVMEEVHKRDFSEFNAAPTHLFSLRHKRAMRKIFSEIAEKSVNYNIPKTKIRLNKRTALILIVIILFAVISGCAVIIYSLGGFKTDVYSDNTQLFPIDFEGCPESIEEVYYLSELSDGFELQEESISDISIYKKYLNSSTGQIITLHQSIKKAFGPHYNTEYSDLVEISINDHIGIGFQGKDFYIIAWDNDDYILKISANMSKDETINLAKSAKVLVN